MLRFISSCGENYLLAAYANTVSISSVSASAEAHETREFVCDASEGSPVVSTITDQEGNYLCCAYESKLACCWNFKTGELLGTCSTYKKPTQVAVAKAVKSSTESTEVFIVSDKGGEVWATDIPFMKKQVRLFGHTASMVTDMLLNSDGNIITADRDEKIRVTQFPATYNIEGYMLSHTDVVTSISLVGDKSDHLMLSSGWDHRICLWNTRTCQQLDCVFDASVAAAKTANKEDSNTAANDDVSTEAAGATAGEGDGEDNDADENRMYDVTQAGSFPMRIASTQLPLSAGSTTVSVAAVICYGLPEIKLVGVDRTAGSIMRCDGFCEGGTTESSFIPTIGTLALPAAPIDAIFSPDGMQLVVLLPAPEYLHVYEILYGEEGGFPVVMCQRVADNCALTGCGSRFLAFVSARGELYYVHALMHIMQ
jgi:hypothetical protein